MPESERGVLDGFFKNTDPEVDIEAIWQAWQVLGAPYEVGQRRPPLPVWARRRLTEDGPQAWEAVQKEAAASDPRRGLCIYVHIPFCAEKCSFCDCYSFRLKSNYVQQVEAYRAVLEKEIHLWTKVGRLSEHAVSTVHFGGGTPLFIGTQAFQHIVSAIEDTYQTSANTEWALETTSSALDEAGLGLLETLGFNRVHVGVQSLDDPLRRLLERSEAAQEVLEKIQRTIRRGCVVSVDLIYGIPQQTPESVLRDIRLLSDSGVDGFSIYPLQISSRNRAILKAYGSQGKSLLSEFFMLQAAEQALFRLGYRKTLFNHYARQKDTNLYFTFPERGEDCLALGTIADGVVGCYHYRHPEYLAYLNGMEEDFPGLQGGLRRTQSEETVQPLEVMILAGKLRQDLFEQKIGLQRSAALFKSWLQAGLIQPVEGSEFRLTASGSWFAGEMMRALG
jgi:coproporphyrinogen III oxidase-like Fe-S oxidoreductase